MEHILGSFTVEIENAFSGDTLTPTEAAAVLKKTLSRLTPKVGTKAPTPEVAVTTSFADQLTVKMVATSFKSHEICRISTSFVLLHIVIVNTLYLV